MNGRYLYQIGDRVRYAEDPRRTGIIVKLVTEEDGEPKNRRNPSNPWYHIEWCYDDVKFIGFESEVQLVPEFVNPIPVLVMFELHENHQPLFKELIDKVNSQLK